MDGAVGAEKTYRDGPRLRGVCLIGEGGAQAASDTMEVEPLLTADGTAASQRDFNSLRKAMMQDCAARPAPGTPRRSSRRLGDQMPSSISLQVFDPSMIAMPTVSTASLWWSRQRISGSTHAAASIRFWSFARLPLPEYPASDRFTSMMIALRVLRSTSTRSG